MILLGTGLRNAVLGDKSLAQLLSGGVIRIYSGFPPDSADSEATGTLLVTITNKGETSLSNKKVMLIPTVAEGVDYSITLEGTTIVYTSQTGDTANTISNALLDKLNKLNGVAFDNGYIHANGIYNNFNFSVDTSGNLIIESALPNTEFSLDVSSNLSLTELAQALPGLHLNYSAVDGSISKLENETWMGKCVASGTAGYFRFEPFDDADDQNDTSMRIQGTVGTANADMIVTTTNFTNGSTQTIDSFTIIFPAHR